MSEKQIENQLVRRLCDANGNRTLLKAVRLRNTGSRIRSLAELCGSREFETLQNNPTWNLHPEILGDVSGSLKPDIVLRSVGSGQNRIIIEVKDTKWLRYGKEDSQIVRYFLHLLATSERRPNGRADIRRAVILAAPVSWFKSSQTGEDWRYFIDHYRDLASAPAFGITLAEWHVDRELCQED